MQVKPATVISFVVGIAILVLVAWQVDFAQSAEAALTVGWGGVDLALPSAADRLRRAGMARRGAVGRGTGTDPCLAGSLDRRGGQHAATGGPGRRRCGPRPAGATTAASVVVDFTLGLAVQAAFAIFVTGLLFARVGAADGLGATALALAVAMPGVIIVGAGQAGYKLTGGRAGGLVASAGEVDRWVRQLYGARGRVAACAAWRFAGWFVRAGEVWLIGWFLGLPIGPVEALIIEGLSHAVRSAAFLLPGALGAQEAGIVAVCLMLGLPAEAGLALALVKRIREVGVGLPGLLAWAWLEQRRGASAAVLDPKGKKT